MRRAVWMCMAGLVGVACASGDEPRPGAEDEVPAAAAAEAAGPSRDAASPQAGPAGDPIVVLRSDISDGFRARTPPFEETARWLGLFEGANGWSLRDVDISWATTADPEPGEDIALHEMSTEPSAPLLLLGDVPGLDPGPALTLAPFGAELRTSSPEVAFGLGDVRYVVRLHTSDGTGCDGVVTLSDGTTTQELYGPPANDPVSCGEPRFDLNWAGDLDGDGRMDLVATFSPKYSLHTRRLFLSSAAAPGELVALVALYDRQA